MKVLGSVGSKGACLVSPARVYFFRFHHSMRIPKPTDQPVGPVGVASMRQEEAIASSASNCVLASYVKSSLNTAPKCSILTSNNKTNSGEGI